MLGKNLHKKNRDFGKMGCTQILKGQTLTAALSHNGDVLSQQWYCMEGSWVYHTYLSKHQWPPPGCYEQERWWASGACWILGTESCLEGLNSSPLPLGRTSQRNSCSSNISPSNDLQKHIPLRTQREVCVLVFVRNSKLCWCSRINVQPMRRYFRC